MVTYDVPSLSPEGAAFVDELQTGYDAFLESWRQDPRPTAGGDQVQIGK